MLNNQFEWQKNIPVEVQQNREMFARFGLVMYYAQCLERQIGDMLATIYNPPFLEASSEDRDSFFDEESAKTLGHMARDIDDRSDLSPKLKNRLEQAVKLRNWLAHEYFSERATDMLTSEGREKMICELQEKADWLKELDSEFTDISKNWLCRMGLSREEIESEIEKVLRRENIE